MMDLPGGPGGKHSAVLFGVYGGGERENAKVLEVVGMFDCLEL